ncbi:Hypothetical protein CINCED_3A021099 [Cinara cedri]|uniref:Uncharacterized protein n=1 Tax=Cinara cedri TaxID=506608 RepID=A0A5E4NJ61_9HEMI|nr:Hypothetical protein CINCED_3A021099 [Cinara cedri]
MDQAITDLERAIIGVQKRIDGLIWKIKQCERVLFSENETSYSCKIMSMMADLTEKCHKYDQILLTLNESRNEQMAYADTLQLQVNLVKSKVETLTALITGGKATEIELV